MPDMVAAGLMTIGVSVSTSTATAIANLAASAALNLVAAELAGSRVGADQARELTLPKSLPEKRFVYGHGARVAGTWVPAITRNGVLYGALILNSRVSACDDLRILVGGQPIGYSGDIFDFGELQHGTATVAAGQTDVQIPHGLSAAPNVVDIAAWNDDLRATIISITATHFTIRLPSAVGASGAVLNWVAMLPDGGATATNDLHSGHLNLWLDRGDQMHPPTQILREVGDLTGTDPRLYWPTDRGTGITKIWIRAVNGAPERRQDRWGGAPPKIEIEADWSRVWDPRDAAQSPTDPATWRASGNQALDLLDFLRNNPIERYSLDQIRLDDFTAAANIADEAVQLKSGGTEPRYQVSGLVHFKPGAELRNLAQPLVAAGAGEIIKSGGKLGYRAGAYTAPEVVLNDYLDSDPAQFQRSRPTRDLKSAVDAVFVSPRDEWEAAKLPPLAVAGGWAIGDPRVETLKLGLVTSATQAMRLRQIRARQLAAQKSFTATFPPSAFEIVAGTSVQLNLPGQRGGTYRAQTVAPTKWLETDDQVAFNMPMTLVQDGPEIWAWDAQTDEIDLHKGQEAPVDPLMPPPLDVDVAISGNRLNIDVTCPGTIETNPNWSWTPDPLIKSFDVQIRRNQGRWRSLQTITVFGAIVSGDPRYNIFGRYFEPVESGSSYDVRVRSVNGSRLGAWVYRYAAQAGFALAAPTAFIATPDVGNINLSVTAPNDSDFAAIQIWGGASDELTEAVQLFVQSGAPGATFTFTDAVGAGATRHYFARCVTSATAVGPWATASATTE